MHRILERSDVLQKTAFAKECKPLGLGEKKARKLIDRGIGRFWKIENTGKTNSQILTAIKFGSLATPIGSAELPNYPEVNSDEGRRLLYD